MRYDDPRWKALAGGYRVPYDPTPVLQRLEVEPTSAQAWAELWNELHHQGDVGQASYAAIPVLVQIQKQHRSLGGDFYAFVATIEVERHRSTNPPLPDWLETEYQDAWKELLLLALADLASAGEPELTRSALGVVALAKNEVKLGALLSSLDSSEIDELVEDFCAWSALYVAG